MPIKRRKNKWDSEVQNGVVRIAFHIHVTLSRPKNLQTTEYKFDI